MKALLQKWLVFGRSQVKKVLKSLEFNYSQIQSLDFMKSYFSKALKKQKELMGGKPMGYYQKITFWKNLKNEWKEICTRQNLINDKKNKLVHALIFWKFARSVVRDEDYTAEEKREFLKTFFQDANKYIQIIATLECLPDVVMKKVLWKGNIDFLSFESFLRRLQPEQEILIRTTYDEFFVQQLHSHSFPTVYKKSVRDFFRFCFHLTSAEKEKNSEYGGYNRWMTKSAWAFNLLGMDFGFSLYPKGVADDTKITNQKFSRFLSIKNHINDFVVNQFDGKYWWFYKTARSNYVWMPSKSVKLKDHICPGFWATLIMHLVFWIVSPIVFTSVFTYWMKHGHSFQLTHLWPVLVSLIPTPLFVFLAMIKLIIRLIEKHGGVVGKLFTGIGSAIRSWFETHKQFVNVLKTIAIGIVIIVVSAIVLSLSAGALYLLWKGATLVYLPMSTKVLLAVVLLFHIVFLIISKFEFGKWDDYHDVPSWIKVFSLFSLMLAVINLYDRYVAKSFENFIANSVVWVKEFVTSQPFTTSLLVSGIALFVINGRFLGLSMKYEEKFAKRSGFVRIVSAMSAVLMIGLFYFANRNEEISFGYSNTFLSIFSAMLGMFVLLFVLMAWITTIKINEDTIEIRNISKDTVDALYSAYSWDFSSKRFKYEPKLNFKRLLKNKWLLNLDKTDKLRVIRKIGRTLARLFDRVPSEEKDVVMNRFINKNLHLMEKNNFWLVRKITSQIVKYRKFASNEQYFFHGLSVKELNSIIQSMLNGAAFSEAIGEVKYERSRKEARLQKFVKFGKGFNRYLVSPIVWFFKKIAQPFIFCGRKIYQFFATLKDLWELFNERCPYVSRSKTLE